MKQIIKITLLTLVALTVLSACGKNNELTGPEPVNRAGNLSEETGYQIADVKGTGPQGDIHSPLWIDRQAEAGFLKIANDQNYLYVTYYLNEGWSLKKASLNVSASEAEIPRDKDGRPLAEQFNNSVSLPRGMSVYTRQIRLSDHGLSLGDDVVIASLAVVVEDSGKNQAGEFAGRPIEDKSSPEAIWWSVRPYRLNLDLSGIDSLGRVFQPKYSSENGKL